MQPYIPAINVLVEGDTDEAVVRRLLSHAGLACGTVYGKQGKADLLRRLPNYNQAARFRPWLVVVDLNNSANCAPDFVRAELPEPAPGMCLRVVVRALEAWLMADAERLAAFLSVPQRRIPGRPDEERDPKAALVNLARHSRRSTIREDMVPREGSGARVGPGYAGRLLRFALDVEQGWRPAVAAERSDSLRRCIAALRRLHRWEGE